MRLTAIDHPKSLILKIAFYFSKKQFGKVIAPLRYIYTRSIPALKVAVRIYRSENKLGLPKATRLFIRYYTAHLNDCPFCSDAIDFSVQRENIALQEWKEYMNFRNSDKFSAKEKALLAYLEEVNFTKTVTDETFAALKLYFTEKEMVEITWINATENYFNMMAKPLGLRSDGLRIEAV